MLVRMLPEQISEYWEIVKFAIENSLPPIANETIDKMNRILENLMNESMQCWVSYSEAEDKNVLDAVIVTTITNDYSSNIKSLLIYSLYGFSNISDKVWSEGYTTLSKWAKSIGCNRITAFTDVERIKEIVKSLGGEAKYTFISLPL